MLERTRAAIERVDGNRVADLHMWSIGPGIYSASLAVVSNTPKPPEYYKDLIPGDLGIVHTVIEVHRLPQ
jgi:Co/Zn/Cd efflux system component